ncbi:alkaline phosphatase family protein [Rhodopila sp.]|uniref:alkaline phosphatase family protein n=1 Tax=Rhodopila sp. TaxID=2480087 RepID=UPI003D11F489
MTRRAVVVVLDGLRRDLVGPDTTPKLHAFRAEATAFGAHRSVFPSATRVVSACFATGCFPARHGLQGNSVALMENGALVARDVGRPDFMDHWRRVRGRTLAVPTLAQRLAEAGLEAMVFSNVSPGAARAHDPDGHGWVYHRAGCFAPGGRRLEAADGVGDVTLDSAGDDRLTGYFLHRALAGREASLAVLWLGEPDHSQHEHPLGSPAAMAAVAAADSCFGRVREAVSARRAAGEEVLLIGCSDHGHQTVTEVVDIDLEFVSAGLKRTGDASLLAVSNGTSALIYLHPDRAADASAVVGFLRGRGWAGEVLEGARLEAAGQAAVDGLVCAVSMRSDAAPNGFGIAGSGASAKPSEGKSDRLGCGQHGGLGAWEQMPFLMISGCGFEAGATSGAPSSVVDLGPTLLRHLGLSGDGCEGRAL